MVGTVILILVVLVLLAKSVYVLREYERGVVFRLGRFTGVRGPGFILIIPFIDRLVRVGLRIIAMDVPPQDVVTRDNVSVKVNAVVYYRVFEPNLAIIEVEDFDYATSQLSQTTLRSVIGSVELDELLSERDKINQELQSILDKQTDSWGIKVSAVEVKHVDLPEGMQRAIARQAEAERERRAKIIHAEGELQASEKLSQAATVLAKEPSSMQLRFLSTLTEISAEKNSTIIFPVPIDLVEAFMKRFRPNES
ncbi:MAG: slipin family protein [Candidatus Eisenbacteria bacterium]|nr:slipin family protein [Candidatus Eisenbacteria bacterium]